MTDLQNLPNVVESILFGAGRPMRLSEMKSLMGSQNIEVDLPSIKVALNSLEERYAESSIEIKEVASGFRMQVRENYGDCLYPLWNDTSSRLSKALMETVSRVTFFSSTILFYNVKINIYRLPPLPPTSKIR